MEQRFDKALLLCPGKYSLTNSLYDILAELSGEVTVHDPGSDLSAGELKINTQIYRFPHSIRKRWEERFSRKANKALLDLVSRLEPELIMVYNSFFLLPETCAMMKKKSLLVFFMGDSPFYTPLNNYYLSCLPYADLIISPDSIWNEQLNTMGLHKTLHLFPGPDTTSYFRAESSAEEPGAGGTDILYVGSCYLNSWGYKKAYLMSRFTDFNFRIYGNSAWKRWFEFFPELEGVYKESGYISTEALNRMFNMTKLIPVDGNPGILAGAHIRMVEALAAGALPLIEYRIDVEKILFKDIGHEIPLIRDYSKAGDIASYWLSDEKRRREMADSMFDYLSEKYSAAKNAARIEEVL